jgi:ketosteroid isomerase-like protein
MYQAAVRRQMGKVYERLSAGDWEAAVARMAPDVHHVFPGDSALGGERHSKEALERWFARLYRLFPSVRFDVREVLVGGYPWNMWVAVWSVVHLTPAAAEPYANPATQWFHFRRGQVVFMGEFVASHLVHGALLEMAANGIEEAAAPPIVTAGERQATPSSGGSISYR